MRNQIKARHHKASGFLIACILLLYSPNCRADSVSYVSQQHYDLIHEGMEVKCTQINKNGACLVTNWRNKDDNTYSIIRIPSDPGGPEDPPFLGIEPDESGIIKIPLAYCKERVSSETHDWELIDNVQPDKAKVWQQAAHEDSFNERRGYVRDNKLAV